MEVGVIGLGAMGKAMARRMLGGHEVVVFDLDPGAGVELAEEGAIPAQGLADLVGRLAVPRVVWLMLPAGPPTEDTLRQLLPMISSGDVVVDGGNSHYQDSITRASVFAEAGIHFLDVGTSGGVEGGENGYSLMIGGPPEITERLAPLFRALAADPGQSWGRVGPNGAGHFAKMVHNGIEYGLMRAYSQGLGALEARADLGLDLHTVTGIWKDGAMARSAILDLTHEALNQNPDLGSLAPYVADAGRDRWTMDEAIDQVAQRGFDRDQFA